MNERAGPVAIIAAATLAIAAILVWSHLSARAGSTPPHGERYIGPLARVDAIHEVQPRNTNVAPTRTPEPDRTSTPEPTSLPEATPTAIPIITIKATPLPAAPAQPDELTAVAERYGDCGGNYEGDVKQDRIVAARASVENNLRTLESLAAIVDAICGDGNSKPDEANGAGEVAKPAATPPPSPAPTVTPATTMTRREQTIDASHLLNMRWARQNSPELAQRLEGKGWVQDGLSRYEYETVSHLLFMAVGGSAQAAERIAAMPFLEQADAVDATATASLWRIARHDRKMLDEVLDHPNLRGGITEQWARVVSVLDSAARYQPEELTKLLDTTAVRLERSAVETPLAGTVHLSIIRTRENRSSAIQTLAEAVKLAEATMNRPFPKGHVALVFTNAVNASNSGINTGSHIAVRETFDDTGDEISKERLASVIGHEIAHHYWSGNDNWIDEGIAEIAGLTLRQRMTGKEVNASNPPCATHDTIGELVKERVPQGHQCSYTLGERMFLELRRHAGTTAFNETIGRLYDRSNPPGRMTTSGKRLTVDDIAELFAETPEAQRIIDRWYKGGIPWDTSRIDQSAPDGKLPSVAGTVRSVTISLDRDGREQRQRFSSSEHTGHVYLNVRYSHPPAGQSVEAKIKIVTYYEDGHVTHDRDGTIRAEPSTTGKDWHWRYSIGTKGTWKPGTYRTMIIDQDRKAAEVVWTVTR